MDCAFVVGCKRTDPHLHCVVPHCTHSITAARVSPWAEWICADHWRMVPKKMRRVKSRLHKIINRAPSFHHHRREQRIWRRIRNIAIQIGAGIR